MVWGCDLRSGPRSLLGSHQAALGLHGSTAAAAPSSGGLRPAAGHPAAAATWRQLPRRDNQQRGRCRHVRLAIKAEDLMSDGDPKRRAAAQVAAQAAAQAQAQDERNRQRQVALGGGSARPPTVFDADRQGHAGPGLVGCMQSVCLGPVVTPATLAHV